MPAEHLELARSIYAAWAQGDFTSFEWADPEIEYVIADGPEAGSSRSRHAMAETIRTILQPWDDARIEADDYIELDDERVLVFNHLCGRGKLSGMDIGQLARNGAAVLHIRDGAVARYVSYNDRGRALSDLGLDDPPARGPGEKP